MKVILTGSTGFIGAEVLRQCLSHPSITSIIVLSRRALPTTDPKLKTVIIKDWLNYEPDVLAELQGAEACIWSLGVKTADIEVQKRVTVDYTLAFMRAVSSLPRPSPSPFRLIFTGGILALRAGSSKTWLMDAPRRIKGDAETEVVAFGEGLEGFVVRPGMVVGGGPGGWVDGLQKAGIPVVRVDVLGAVMVGLAVGEKDGNGEKGGETKRVWENGELGRWGRELLNREK